MKQYHVIAVGSGLGSLIAACRLVEQNVTSIAVVTSGLGGTPYIAAFDAVLEGNPYGDNLSTYREDMIRAGYGINDRNLIEAMSIHMQDCVTMLERWGVSFTKNSTNSYLLRQCSGSSYPRALCRNDMLIGWHIADTLIPALKQKGVIFYENCQCVHIIKDSRGAAGCTVFDEKSGEVFNLYSRRVIAGWGGIGHLYQVTTYPPDIDGRTLAMAWEAGACLIDLEFVEFEPMVCLEPEGIRGEPCPTAMLGEGGYLKNSKGERFLLKVRPQGECGAPKSVINAAVYQEVKAGCGSPAGGVYADLRHLDEAVLKSYPWFYNRLINAGINPKERMIEVGPVAHSHSGGMEIDTECRTCVPGLYAVGEAAGGMHGACRMAGNACTQAVLSGYCAAESIGRGEIPLYGSGELPVEFKRSKEVHERYAGEIRRIVRDTVGIEREGKRLEQAVARLEEIIGESVCDTKTCQLALSALLLTAAAWERKESRGTHFRTDYPEEREDFLCSYRILNKEGRIEAETVMR